MVMTSETGETVTVPLRCAGCGRIVGTAQVEQETADTAVITADADHHLDRHLPDCRIGASLRVGSIDHISIDPENFPPGEFGGPK